MNELIDNPPEGYKFTGSYPYPPVTMTILFNRSNSNIRRMAHYHDPVTRKSKTTTYARMRYSIYLWNTQQIAIHRDYEVDHIDNDCSNDTLNNYQLLTSKQNAVKAAAVKGEKQVVLVCPICIHIGQTPYCLKHPANTQCNPNYFDKICFCSLHHRHIFFNIKDAFKDEESIKFICNNQILYIGTMFKDTPWSMARFQIEKFGSRAMLDPMWELRINGEIPLIEGSRYYTIKEKVNLIKEKILSKKSIVEISIELNIRRQQVLKLLNKHLPELVDEVFTKPERCLEIIKKRLEENVSIADIAKELDLREKYLGQIMRDKLGIFRKISTDKRSKEEIETMIKSEYEKGLSCAEIARIVNVNKKRVVKYTKEHLGRGFREIKPGAELTKLINDIKELSTSGLSLKNIAKKLNQPRKRIYHLHWDHVKHPKQATKI